MSRRRVLAVVAFIVFAAIGLAVDPNGLRHSWSLLDDVDRIEGEIAELRQTNERLRLELRSLADDPSAWERVAREELGLVRPDDVIFRLEDGHEAHAP